MYDIENTFPEFWGRPRALLACLPTPLILANTLASAIGCRSLLVKRDDLTEALPGGNKYRQMEFYMGEAMQQGATCLLATGSLQSNFVVTAAAAAARYGLKFVGQRERRVANSNAEYACNGNALILELYQPHQTRPLDSADNEELADQALLQLSENLRTAGEIPYAITMGPTRNPVGALGYVQAAMEFAKQCSEGGHAPHLIAVGSGSGLTHAGLLIGLRWLGLKTRVVGYCVRRSAEEQRLRIKLLLSKLENLLGKRVRVSLDDIEVSDAGLGAGYGIADKTTLEAIKTTAQCQGLLLDPVYTGKVISGLMQDIRDGVLGDAEDIVFWHTGGISALFAYRAELGNMLSLAQPNEFARRPR